MEEFIATVTTGAGTTGAVNKSATAAPWAHKGLIHSVYLDYGSVTSITNVTITNGQVTILSIADNATDGMYYPRALAQTNGGTALVGGSAAALMFPVTHGQLRVSVSSSTPSVTALTAHFHILP